MNLSQQKVTSLSVGSMVATSLGAKTRLTITANSPLEALGKAKQLFSDRPIRSFGLEKAESKYAPETEKNLDLAFAAAERLGAVLLFDEADALFGKRSDVKEAHDRYANIPIGAVTERIQAYRGVVIIASSQPSTLDSVLLRKYAFVRIPPP